MDKMDGKLKRIVDGLENIKIGLDETFSFHCGMYVWQVLYKQKRCTVNTLGYL